MSLAEKFHLSNLLFGYPSLSLFLICLLRKEKNQNVTKGIVFGVAHRGVITSFRRMKRSVGVSCNPPPPPGHAEC